jgi:predicted amidohydrolase
MVQLRVALAQTCPINAEINSFSDSGPFSTLEANLLDATNQVKAASQAGADVVVFPEYFLQGLVDQGRQVSTTVRTELTASTFAIRRST